MLKTTWKVSYRSHTIEVENRPFLERLIVDGKEIARAEGVTFKPRTFAGTVTAGGKSMLVRADTLASRSPRGLRCTVSVDGQDIYSEVRWPPRWSLAVGVFTFAMVCWIAAAVLRYYGD